MFKLVSAVLAVALLSGVAFAGVDEDLQALETKLQTNIKKCINSVGTSHEELEKIFMEGVITNKSGCFISCFAKEFGVMNADNKFDKEKLYKIVEPIGVKAKQENQETFFNKAKAVLDSCLESQTGGTDTCAVAKKGGECLLAGAKKDGLLKNGF